MTRYAISLVIFVSFSLFAEDEIPESINITGKAKFTMRTTDGQVYMGDYISSASELTSASECHISISASDDYFNHYPVDFNLYTIDESVVPFIQMRALYLDQNSRYSRKNVSDFSFQVADVQADAGSWYQKDIDGFFVLFSPSLEHGLLAFHHITLGQPINIEIQKSGSPEFITISVPPLSAKVASYARKCMKLIDANA